MYMLYLDDSGSPGNKQESHFVLGGICIPEESLYWLSNKLDSLAKSIDSADPSSVDFHASEIFRGKTKPWDKFKKKNERINLIKSVLDILSDSYQSTVLFATSIHKDSFSNHNPVELAFEDIVSRFDMYLDRLYHEKDISHKGLIVIDKSAYEKTLQHLSIDFRKEGTRWRALRNIREVPFFVDSKASRLIQMADHIAYSVFRRYSYHDLSYFNCIEGKFDFHNQIYHGLSHKQTVNPNCTCPACLSRIPKPS